ncbi:extracellular solute-binding protein [Labrys wisconsinensis]|uniref:Multiple sugar transport system substrate-binding protein n=1 Tax=Labrys wisconsinensis TaxID=425677 RepID=A0ABU0JH96_9HYPH|nr:extracellular solute-binding protein [Labrys wisconsinensis]MDQ0473663.1 multiple sugar transport system substrate-binding protein [Labrys wisconsinensis]
MQISRSCDGRGASPLAALADHLKAGARRLIAPAVAAVIAAVAPAQAASPPEAAKIDWKQQSGTTIDLFLVKHPWTDGVEPLLPEFEKLTGIKLNVTTVTEDAYWNKASLGMTAAKPPFDVLFMSMGITGVTAYSNNWIAKLNTFLDDPKLTDKSWYDYADFYPAAATAFRMPTPASEGIYGIPMSTEVYMMFYRKDLFEKAGIDAAAIGTFDEWFAALDKLKLDDGSYRAALRGGGLGILDELNAAVADSWGSAPYEKDRFVYFDANWKPRFDDPRIVKGFDIWASLMKRSAPGVTAFDWYEATSLFAQGKAATFGPDASLFASIFIDPKQSTVADKIGFRPVPAASPDGAHTAMWSWGLSIPEKSAKKEAAWLFVQWATSPAVTEQIARKTLAAPRKSTWDSKDFQAALPPGFGDAVGKSLAIAQPSIMYLQSADKVVEGMLDALHAIYQGTPAADAAKTLQETATDVVTEAGLYKP